MSRASKLIERLKEAETKYVGDFKDGKINGVITKDGEVILNLNGDRADNLWSEFYRRKNYDEELTIFYPSGREEFHTWVEKDGKMVTQTKTKYRDLA